MVEYYKLSVLRESEAGALWEFFYLEMNGEESKILFHDSSSRIIGSTHNSNLEKITEEEIKKATVESNIDRTYG